MHLKTLLATSFLIFSASALGESFAELTCKFTRHSEGSEPSELEIDKAYVKIRQHTDPSIRPSVIDTKILGTLKGKPIEFNRYCLKARSQNLREWPNVRELGGGQDGHMINLWLGQQKKFHFQKFRNGFIRDEDIELSLGLSPTGKLLGEGARHHHKVTCEEGIDVELEEPSCVSGYLPESYDTALCGRDDETPNPETHYAKLCRENDGVAVACKGDVDSVCSVNVRSMLQARAYSAYDIEGNLVRCPATNSGGFRLAIDTVFRLQCFSAGGVPLDDCRDRQRVESLCTKKVLTP